MISKDSVEPNKQSLLKYIGIDIDRLPDELGEIVKSRRDLDYYEKYFLDKANLSVDKRETFCIKDVIGTRHPDYGNKSWIESFNSLKRVEAVIRNYEYNPSYWDNEMKDQNHNFEAVSLVKVNDKYYIWDDGNNRLIFSKLLYLCEKEHSDEIDDKYTFSGNIKSITKDKDVQVMIVLLEEKNKVKFKINTDNADECKYIINDEMEINSKNELESYFINNFYSFNAETAKDFIYDVTDIIFFRHVSGSLARDYITKIFNKHDILSSKFEELRKIVRVYYYDFYQQSDIFDDYKCVTDYDTLCSYINNKYEEWKNKIPELDNEVKILKEQIESLISNFDFKYLEKLCSSEEINIEIYDLKKEYTENCDNYNNYSKDGNNIKKLEYYITSFDDLKSKYNLIIDKISKYQNREPEALITKTPSIVVEYDTFGQKESVYGENMRETYEYKLYMNECDFEELKSQIAFVTRQMSEDTIIDKEKLKKDLKIMRLVLEDKQREIQEFIENNPEVIDDNYSNKNVGKITSVINYMKEFNKREIEEEKMRMSPKYKQFMSWDIQELKSLSYHIFNYVYESGMVVNPMVKAEKIMYYRIIELALNDKIKELENNHKKI